jgi:hypothetical protein
MLFKMYCVHACVLVLSLGCSEAPERTVSTKKDDIYSIGDGDGDGDGDSNNGDGDGDSNSGDGDGDAGSGGAGGGGGNHDGGGAGNADTETTGVVGNLHYELIPTVSGADLVVPIAISNEGHVLLHGLFGADSDHLYIWRGGPNEPTKLDLPDGYTMTRSNSHGCLLSGDRVVVELSQGDQEVAMILEGDTVEALRLPADVIAVDVTRCNGAGDILAVSAAPSNGYLGLLSTDRDAMQVRIAANIRRDTRGMNEAGVIGFTDTYWEDGEYADSSFGGFDFVGVSGPSAAKTMLGHYSVPSERVMAPSLFHTATQEIVPIAALDGTLSDPEPILMLENGDYVVTASIRLPVRDALFLFHGGSYTLLERGDVRAVAAVGSNGQSDLLVRVSGSSYAGAVFKGID